MSLDPVPDGAVVRNELEKLLSSETFAQSESLKRFLRYVVEAKLDGRESGLKEQVLGAEVFGRGEGYDPRIDPIVRVQATRLRTKLRDYYLTEGAGAKLTIDLPKGSYIPAFHESEAREEAAERGRPKVLLRGLAILGAVLVVAALWRLSNAPDPAGSTTGPGSIAVLPFTDMSPAGDHEYFGDGLAEEITTDLASIEGLEVVPRTSAFRFKEERVPLAAIASELDVSAVLQGSVRVEGEKLRVQSQLIRVSDRRQLWAETYDRPLEDAFEVQEQIARAVARAVERNLLHPQSADPRFVPAGGVYDDYLRGTFERERNTPLSLARSIALFQSVIDRDPDFAPAHAGLVESYVLELLWSFAPPSETRESARKASERALALAGDHPQALAAAASYRLLYEWDTQGVEALLTRAGDADEARLVRAVLLAARGNLGEAALEIERASSLARHRPLVHYLGAAVAFHRGEYENALARARSILEWAPDHPLTWHLLSRIQERLGRFEGAEEALAGFERFVNAPLMAGAQRAVLLAHRGRTQEAKELLLGLEGKRALGYVPPGLLARVHAALGEADAALAELDAARIERSFHLLFFASDPDYELLRSDPRFAALVQRIGLVVR
jgi:TolB-like protein/predicted Zn-dependent protease